MFQFLGVWYQVQPDLDSDDQSEQNIPSCEYYNIANDVQRNTFLVSTTFELYPQLKEKTPYKYESLSTGHLIALDESLPAKMTVTPTAGTYRLMQMCIFSMFYNMDFHLY